MHWAQFSEIWECLLRTCYAGNSGLAVREAKMNVTRLGVEVIDPNTIQRQGGTGSTEWKLGVNSAGYEGRATIEVPPKGSVAHNGSHT